MADQSMTNAVPEDPNTVTVDGKEYSVGDVVTGAEAMFAPSLEWMLTAALASAGMTKAYIDQMREHIAEHDAKPEDDWRRVLERVLDDLYEPADHAGRVVEAVEERAKQNAERTAAESEDEDVDEDYDPFADEEAEAEREQEAEAEYEEADDE